MIAKSSNKLPLTHEEWYRKYFPRGNTFPIGGSLTPGPTLNQGLMGVQVPKETLPTKTSGPINGKIGALDKTMGGLGAAVTMFDAYKNNAETKDMSGIEDSMIRKVTTVPEASSREALVNQWNNLTDIKDDYTYKDIRQNDMWDDVSNTLNSVGAGLAAGSMIGGPVGAAIGGVAGLGASIAGIFTGRDKAKKEAERLNNMANWANTSRINNLEAGAQSLDATDALNAMRNYAAYGGILNSMGRYDNGGKLSTHGSDFTNGARYINAGGTHEENPYEGVQMGTDSEGTPNLVEEGEVVYDDYVFSDRLKPSKTALKASNLPEKYEGLTFARIAEDLLSESKERPNDPISKDGAKVMLQRLQDLQESQRGEEEEIQSYMDMFRNMSPEDMQATAQGMTMPQAEGQQVIPEQPVTDNSGLEMMQPNIQMPPGATPVITANGGPIVNRFANGGKLTKAEKAELNAYIDAYNNAGTEYKASLSKSGRIMITSRRTGDIKYQYTADKFKSEVTNAGYPVIPSEAVNGGIEPSVITAESMTQSEIIDAFNNNHNSPFHIIRDGNRFRIEDYNGRVLQRVYPRELNNIYNRYKDQLEGNATLRTFERTVIDNPVIRRTVRQYNNFNGPFKAGINTYDGSVYLMNRATNTFVGGYQTGADFVNDYKNPNSGLFTGSIGQSTTQTPVIPTEEAVAENTPRVVNKPSYQAASVPSSQADTVATPRVSVDNPATTGSPTQTVASQSSTSQPVATNSRTNTNQPTTTTRGNGGSRPYRYSYDKNINGEEFETQPIYKAFVQYLSQLSDSTNENDIKQRDAWQKYIQDELNKAGKKYKFTNFKDLVRLATDGKIGIVHQIVNKLAQQRNTDNQLAETVTSATAPTIKMPTTPTDWSVAGLANNMFTKAATPTGMKAAIGPTEDYVPEMTDREKRKAARKARREERRAARAEKGENFDPLRYAGILGNVVGLAGNRLDYTEPEAFMTATANPRSVAFTPIGRYMTPTYMASEEYVTPLMNQINATRDTIRSTSNGNSASANAALIAAQNAGIGQIGAARLQGKQYNNAQRNAALQWNSNIDKYNSQESMQAQAANMNLNNYFYQRALANAQMRTEQRNAYDQARSTNLTALFNNIANVGRENIANNMANSSSMYGYAIDLGDGQIRYIPR